MHNSVLEIWYSIVYYFKGPTVTNPLVSPPYELANKIHCVWKVPIAIIKASMFQPLKCHYQGVRTVMHVCIHV